MQPQSGILKYNDNEVHCLRMGKGSRLLIAFHGFGNDASLFAPLAALLQDQYTTISIDLPGHGLTRWKDPFFQKKDLMAIVQGIRNDFGTEKFSLLGFSLGGRVCLTIAELQPNWIEQMILLAPDGLEHNFWYNMATRNLIGKSIFKKVMQQPEGWLKRVDFLRKYKIIDESRFKFAKAHLTDEKIRHQLSYVWPVTSKLMVNTALVKWNLNKYKVDTQLFMGRHDRIFPPAQGERFVKKLKTAKLHILDSGHQLLAAPLLPKIAASFL